MRLDIVIDILQIARNSSGQKTEKDIKWSCVRWTPVSFHLQVHNNRKSLK